MIEALRSVDDPEYPGISVIDMGMIGEVSVTDGRARVELIPTFSGCPALEVIVADIAHAVHSLDGIVAVAVERSDCVWTPARLSRRARHAMARDFTVAVAMRKQPTECPMCGANDLVEQSAFGPSRCRAIHRCSACHEIVEVLRA